MLQVLGVQHATDDEELQGIQQAPLLYCALSTDEAHGGC